MSDISNSKPTDLPTSRQLIRSTVIAAIVASFILVAVVMPAEYGVDPTGVGSALGLTEMGKIKVSLAKEAEQAENAPAAEPAPAPAAAASDATAPAATTSAPGTPAGRSDVTTIALQPGQGREIKLVMREGARADFSWSTDRGVVNFDEHADSKVPRRDYHGYRKGTAVAKDEGVLVAAFDGSHGWFWRNRGQEPLTVTLRTSGDYQELKEVK